MKLIGYIHQGGDDYALAFEAYNGIVSTVVVGNYRGLRDLVLNNSAEVLPLNHDHVMRLVEITKRAWLDRQELNEHPTLILNMEHVLPTDRRELLAQATPVLTLDHFKAVHRSEIDHGGEVWFVTHDYQVIPIKRKGKLSIDRYRPDTVYVDNSTGVRKWLLGEIVGGKLQPYGKTADSLEELHQQIQDVPLEESRSRFYVRSVPPYSRAMSSGDPSQFTIESLPTQPEADAPQS